MPALRGTVFSEHEYVVYSLQTAVVVVVVVVIIIIISSVYGFSMDVARVNNALIPIMMVGKLP